MREGWLELGSLRSNCELGGKIHHELLLITVAD